MRIMTATALYQISVAPTVDHLMALAFGISTNVTDVSKLELLRTAIATRKLELETTD